MKDKSEQQKLFEQIRHWFGSKHQVPEHMTAWELGFVLSLINKGDKR